MAAAALVLSACSTPYQPIGQAGGFEEQMISENEYAVRFLGNGFTNKRKANDLALLRAAEIGERLKFKYFVIVGKNDLSSTSSVSTGSTSTTTGSVYGGTYTGTTTTTPTSIPVYSPGSEIRVRYFEDKPEGRFLEILNVEVVAKLMRRQYKIR